MTENPSDEPVEPVEYNHFVLIEWQSLRLRFPDLPAVAMCGKVWEAGEKDPERAVCPVCEERWGTLPWQSQKDVQTRALLDQGAAYVANWKYVRGFLAEGQADGQTEVEIARLADMMDDLRREADKPLTRAQTLLQFADRENVG